MTIKQTPALKVIVAEITSAHGIRGQFKVRTFTQDPEDIFNYGDLQDINGKTYKFKIHSVKLPNQLIVSIDGVNDRNAAELLRATSLYVDRHRLPELTGEEFYHDQLIGLTVNDQDGKILGTIKAVHNFGAGDFFDVKLVSGEIATLLFRKESVLEVNIAAKTIIADPSQLLTLK